MAKAIKSFVLVLLVLFNVWFLASWIDIVADNSQPNPTHSEYNMFVVMANSQKGE